MYSCFNVVVGPYIDGCKEKCGRKWEIWVKGSNKKYCINKLKIIIVWFGYGNLAYSQALGSITELAMNEPH